MAVPAPRVKMSCSLWRCTSPHGDARSWYNNVDKLIHYANKDGRVNAFYSTPSKHFAVKRAGKEQWALKEDNFSPTLPMPMAQTSGQGTLPADPPSRSRLERHLLSCKPPRQLEVLAELQPSNTSFIGTSRGRMAPGAATHKATASISSVAELNDAIPPDADTAVLEYSVAMSLHHDGPDWYSPSSLSFKTIKVGCMLAWSRLSPNSCWGCSGCCTRTLLQAQPHTPKTSPAEHEHLQEAHAGRGNLVTCSSTSSSASRSRSTSGSRAEHVPVAEFQRVRRICCAVYATGILGSGLQPAGKSAAALVERGE